MNTSTYYGLNLAEGSDIVNPLIIDVPNYEKIDEVMHDNAVAGVGTATELLTGTVHALVRDNDETAIFRFVATANFTAGDTFTVDGVQVTALLPSGESLGSGAYVINANVLCVLTGTLLTMYVPSGTVTTAEDAERLGGELPSYYGTASEVAQANAVAQASSVLVNQLNALLTLDYSQSSLPSSEQNINSFLQKVLLRLFPKQRHITGESGVIGGAQSYSSNLGSSNGDVITGAVTINYSGALGVEYGIVGLTVNGVQRPIGITSGGGTTTHIYNVNIPCEPGDSIELSIVNNASNYVINNASWDLYA